MALTLDAWLARLGLRRDSAAEDGAAHEQAIISRPLVLTGADYDEKGHRVVAAASRTTYDAETGTIEDRITFWRHLPLGAGNDNARDSQLHDIISIRGTADPSHSGEGQPRIIPDQIWVGKKIVFNRMDGDDPDQPKNQRLINRILDLSGQVKNHLNNGRPVRELGRILSGGDENGDVLAMIAAETPLLRSLDRKSGFESTLTPFFLESAQMKGEKMRFFDCDDTQLKTMLGFRVNTVDPGREHMRGRFVAGTAQQSGMSYRTGVRFLIDKDTGRRVLSLYLEPDDPPADMPAPAPFEIARLEFSRDGEDVAVLEHAAFMQNPLGDPPSFRDALNLIGFVQEANGKYIASYDYPPYRDLAARHRLLERVNVMHTPPSLEKEGGEFLWIPLNGCSLEKKVDVFGDGIGGGNMFMSRGLKKDGSLSEVAVVVGFPFATGGPKSDWDGMNADFTPYWDAIKYFILDHDHFDHATVEYYACKGWLRGKTIICDERVRDIVETRMNNLKVPRDARPMFVTPPPKQDVTNYPVRDEEGNIRIWVQFCKNGTKHSALTSLQMMTGCYNDDHYGTTFCTYNDGFGLTKHGWKFVEEGPRGLAREPGVTAAKVDKDIDVVFHDPTAAPYGGDAPEPEQTKDTWRECLKTVQDKAVVFVPFSTNHLEYQSIAELCAEKGVMRNYTTVGANAQVRATCLNKHGVNPYLDLPEADIPADRITLWAYETAMTAVKDYLKSFDREERKGTAYLQCKGLYEQVRAEYAAGNKRPAILHDAFMRGEDAYFLQDGGLHDAVRIAWKKQRKEQADFLAYTGQDPRADTTLHMLSSLAEHGRVTFRDNGHNSYAMYNAIMAGQPESILYAGRTSNTGQGFRADLGHLAVISTGPTGTAEEHFATLPRYADYWSLFDVDEEVRSTGYPLDDKNTVFFVTQPAPPVPGAEDAQEQLMKDLVAKRDVTIFCSFRNGFKVYNPKDKLPEMMKHFRELGWQADDFDAANNCLRVHNQPFHIHGHGFFNNLLDMVRRIPAKLHEFIHIPSATAFMRAREIVELAGKVTSITHPDDHRALKFTHDPNTGQPKMEVTDNLMQSFWLIRLRRQFGRQFGGIVEMVRAIVLRRKGESSADGLDVRTTGDGVYMENSPMTEFNGFLKPGAGAIGARQRKINPSPADVQTAGTRPVSRPAFSVSPWRAA